MISKIDSKGRIYIPKKFRSRIKGDIYIVELNQGLLILPIPNDPIKELEEAGKGLPDLSFSEFKEAIQVETDKELKSEL